MQSEDGTTSVEYAVLLTLLVMVCIGSLNSVGLKVNNTFSTVSSKLQVAAGS